MRARRWLIDPEFARRVPPVSRGGWSPYRSVRASQLRWLRDGHLSTRMEYEIAEGARFGIEPRYPLLDRHVVEFALSQPPEAFSGPPSRCLMRHAASRVLPGEVCWSLNKAEPAFGAAEEEVWVAAMPLLQDAVLAPEGPLSRAQYVNLSALIERLGDVEAQRRKPRPLAFTRALGFLDF